MSGRKRKRNCNVKDGALGDPTETSGVPSTVRALVGGEEGIVLTLPDFISKYAPSLPELDFGDSTDEEQLCRTLVSPPNTLKPIPGIKTASRSQSLTDLVDEVIWSLVQRKSRDWSERNTLDHGYVISDRQGACLNMRPGVVCTKVNDNVNFLKTSSYAETLYKSVGDAVMRILLLQCLIFLPIEGGNQNFILLCGPSRSSTSSQVRVIDDSSTANTEFSDWQANDFISRQSLFYSHAYIPKIGFPSTHILHQKDPNKLLNAMAQLYSAAKKGGKKRRKRWQRLRGTGLSLCREILRKHDTFDYHRSLNRCCPLPEFAKSGSDAGVVKLAVVGAAHTPAASVAAFLKQVVQKVFPLEFWGSNHNLDKVKGMLEVFVNLRRNERFPKKALVDGVKVTEIPWMWPPGARNKSGHEAATALLRKVVQWVVVDCMIPLLRSLFYVTESEFSSKRVLYYRKPVWSIFRALSLKKLTEKQYKEVSAAEATALLDSQAALGLSRLKLVPKTTGVRPIAMLSMPDTVSDRGACKNHESSINSKLANAYELLRHEQGRNPELFGAGKLSIHTDVYPPLKSFLAKVSDLSDPTRKQTKEKLYFVSVDIEKCYDNVHQQFLFQIIEEVLQEDHYLIQRHSVTHPFDSLGRPVWRPMRRVGLLQDYDSFHGLACKQSPYYSESVFVNGSGCSIVKKRDVLKQLKQHLESNIVAIPGRYGKRFFLQKRGIPQGSVLSSFLCNYYFGRIEKLLLGDLLTSDNDNDSVLFRITDDFILITTNREKAVQFLEKMKEGKPDLGVSINEDKTVTNLGKQSKESRLIALSGRTFFPWCGLLIDTASGEIRLDYSRFTDEQALDALTIDRCQVGKNLEIRMMTYVRPRCQPILFDCEINSFDTIVVNFAQVFLLAAVKTQEYIRSVIDVEKNKEFIHNAIDDTIDFARNLVIKRLKQEEPFQILKEDVRWIGRHAFQRVLPKGLVRDSKANDPKNRRLRRAVQVGISHFELLTCVSEKS